MLDRILNYYYTIKDLKWIQIRYQLLYRFFKRKYKRVNYNEDISFLHLVFQPEAAHSLVSDRDFTFLNQFHSFKKEIDWDFGDFGKLWTYNLNYFDFLNQEDVSAEVGRSLIESFIKNSPTTLDPYPTSLRLINWIKFSSKHEIKDKSILESIYSQSLHLTKCIEYHLMGNHLLENGFALLFAGFYFSNGQFFKKAEEILRTQLTEQILDDGGHFELSPMYHSIIFYRVLEAVDLVRNNNSDFPTRKLLDLLEEKAKDMYSWLSAMTFADGSMPMFNDSTQDIAMSPKELFSYAKALNIQSAKKKLGESGYRKIEHSDYELFFDVGQIGPAYIPGHAHSDTLSILMHLHGKPFLVDRGISTYEKNSNRQVERQTESHNTVTVNGQEQSSVWGGFRVGRKAKITDLIEKENTISATHDGYNDIGAFHTRTIDYSKKSILVNDHVSKEYPCVAVFHFHPDVKVQKKGKVIETDECIFSFDNAENLEIFEYNYSEGFNHLKKAYKGCVSFNLMLTTEIKIK